MGLLLGGSVLTVFELLDLIVFRFVITLFTGKQKPAADGDDEAEAVGGTCKLQSARLPEHPVSPVSTINPAQQRRIRRISKYQPPTPPVGAESPPTVGPGGRPALVVQTTGTATPGGTYRGII